MPYVLATVSCIIGQWDRGVLVTLQICQAYLKVVIRSMKTSLGGTLAKLRI
jgi:hypothetical protein